MVEFNGRILETPEILYGNGQTAKCNMGAWEMKERGKKESMKYFEPVDIHNWFIIGAEPEKLFKKSDLDAMGQKFMKVAAEVGMKMKAPRVTILKESRDKNARMKLLEEIVKHCLKLKPDLIMFVISQQDSYLYNKMKALGDVQYGVHTQCILSKNAKGNKLNPQLIGNVLLKINAKLHGINNQVKTKTENGIMSEPTLILGADVTHPSPGSNGPSIAALVGSMNKSASKYQCEIQVQTHRQEMIGSKNDPYLEEMTTKILKGFFKETAQKPRHIIYYRDGVSEGQFDEIMTTELRQIHEACKKLEEGYEPNLTVLICQKRHHTRLFCKNEKDADRSKNVPPGTVVDSDIVSPRNFNFYL
jgi:eukaryotic translation initiation factor 2C